LRHWRERFLANREQILSRTDDRFCRMWEYYLVVSELAFRYQDMMNFQPQIARHQEAVPITRDYIGRGEAALRGAGQREAGRTPLRLAGD
jgi:cyclopropane-fatty-acyl-phospholipid synthase